MRIVLVGEGMIEFSGDSKTWHIGHGGDTLNTAIHLARFGRSVAFATALGNDLFSDRLRVAWDIEGIDTKLILLDPARQPGLYTIQTDANGERAFTYWRGDSAARQMFALPGSEALLAAATEADWLCYSLISLAILPPAGRTALYDLSRRVRARGGLVVFDGNYRPRLWANRQAAMEARDAAIACCNIGLPTLEDEVALSGAADDSAVAKHWAGLGAREVVVKLGPRGCRIPGGQIIPPPAVLDAMDTSGAGDAFNAGFLHARMAGADIAHAALMGQRLAGWVIMQRGAIPARTVDAPYGAMVCRADA